jgi:hypothetical protein
MYSTCLFCKTSLGENEAIEQFPIGRRLAFDAAKGRLWVVCRKCERWNLTPLEQRWEAIETCEQSFRGTKLRTSTDQIGLARLSEGLELVRIGKPLRPEFAAWRYGDQFGSRRRRHFIQRGAVVAAVVTIPIAGPALGLTAGVLGMNYFHIANFASTLYDRMKITARIPGPEGDLLVRRHDVDEVVILPPKGGAPWGLRIQHRGKRHPDGAWWRYEKDTEKTDIYGDEAVRAAAQLLPRLNRKGASASVVQEAVKLAARQTDPRGAFSDAAHLARRMRNWDGDASVFLSGRGPSSDLGKLAKLPADRRLSLEMISHEDSERRALEGELHLLEEAWREAEEIAGISDNLFLPSEISTQLEDLKRRRE